jgi:iron(III) transport system substrate-binding protein
MAMSARFAVAMLAGAAAAVSSPRQVAAAVPPDWPQVVAAAKKEGKLVWYTSLTIYKEMAKALEARYPGVVVEPYQ